MPKPSRIARNAKRRALLDAHLEEWAARSAYSRKAWTKQHGSTPDPNATAKLKAKL